MKKRKLFAEIAEGFDALAEERAGKRTFQASPLHPMTLMLRLDTAAGEA